MRFAPITLAFLSSLAAVTAYNRMMPKEFHDHKLSVQKDPFHVSTGQQVPADNRHAAMYYRAWAKVNSGEAHKHLKEADSTLGLVKNGVEPVKNTKLFWKHSNAVRGNQNAVGYNLERLREVTQGGGKE